jgi:Patatin-like phospholipase
LGTRHPIFWNLGRNKNNGLFTCLFVACMFNLLLGMKRALKSIYYFLPVQLLFLHFRKYQLLLVFWGILAFTITGRFAAHFGAASLFLAPEYLGNINMISMFLLGCSMCVFFMMWHITTFIIHSKRIPYIGATRNAFVLYCLNNSIIPIAFLVFYSATTIRYQWVDEHASGQSILALQLGFYVGMTVVTLFSFLYFFRVGRDLLKSVLTKITNPSLIREIIPYDSLDYEVDIIHAESYLSGLRIHKSSELEPYHPRVMNTVLRRHHRNVLFATFVSYIMLVLLGIFMDEPLLRIPAGCGFLLLFSIVMGIVAAVEYFLKSWDTIGWLVIALLLSLMVKYGLFDLRSVAYGLNYRQAASEQPVYDYDHLKSMFNAQRYAADKKTEESRLDRWKQQAGDGAQKPSLVVVAVSGGGSRAAYWSFRTLQYMDSLAHGKLFRNTVVVTGASGGMIGAAYWRSIHQAVNKRMLQDAYSPTYQVNIGKDLLNAIVFSLASVDLVSPFIRKKIAGYTYTRDRGYAMEQELISNTQGLMDQSIGYFKPDEDSGKLPQLIVNGTIVNDGRMLLISSQPLGYLTQPRYSLYDSATCPVDAVDFTAFFSRQNPYNLRLTSALRMEATFPYILPVVKLPSKPSINVMDAGLRDNFGAQVAARYLSVMHDWIKENTSNVLVLQIRDTRESEVAPPSDQSSLGSMITDPVFVIQNKWEMIESYYDGYLRDLAPNAIGDRVHFFTLQYVPEESKKAAALNFHLTQREKDDLYQSVYNTENQESIRQFLQLLH